MRALVPVAGVLLLAAGCAGAAALGQVDRRVCAHGPGGRMGDVPDRGLSGGPWRGAVAPAPGPARLFPLVLDAATSWGTEPGGGRRAIVAGMRVVTWSDGSMAASADRLPTTPSSVVQLPERLGGGFVFAAGVHLWRADAWLSDARPLLTAPVPVASVLVGLDRIYARSVQGAMLALDPRSGAPMDLGPLPASPRVTALAALDAWRAVAAADLRGALLTTDAGSTWRPLPLPIEASEVLALGDAIAIGGLDASRRVEWWQVRGDGGVGRMPPKSADVPSPRADLRLAWGTWRGWPPPHRRTVASTAPADARPARAGTIARTLGPRPLAAAIEDGWPLADGTALVARDGMLARVRLADGAVVQSASGAFALNPARCHPVSLAHGADPAAFGFVCGEARGRTIVTRWSPDEGRLVELRAFAAPREVLAPGNGALAVRGPCAPDASGDVRGAEVAFCLMHADGTWQEMHFRGDDVDRARLVPRADGHVALVRPPRDGDLSTARLTTTDGVHATHTPLVVPEVSADVARVLRAGVWMDGFEERQPGVLSGWVADRGAVLGIEVALDGKVRVGELIRDAGEPFVSGRWALGWTASRLGFESTDGGMTWRKDLELPEPIAPPGAVAERACGPVGCLAAGWMRVGWGGEGPPVAPPAPRVRLPGGTIPSVPLELACEPASGPAPPSPPAAASATRRAPTPLAFALSHPWMYGPAPAACASPFAPFEGRRGPALLRDECGVEAGSPTRAELLGSGEGLARIYAWGPRSGDWDGTGKWKITWLWPWGDWADVRASSAAPAPWPSRELAARMLGPSYALRSAWTLLTSQDADHALLVARRPGAPPSSDVVLLETDQPPVEVRRADGDALPEVEAAASVGGRWFVATAQAEGELPATVVWQVDGGSAREIARLPRTGIDPSATLRLAPRTDGRALGVVVEGQPGFDRRPRERWVVGIDLESRTVEDPEPLAALDLRAGATVALCTGDDSGWQVELPYREPVDLTVGARATFSLQTPVVRARLSRDRACLERIAGALQEDSGAFARVMRPVVSYASAPLAGLRTTALRPDVRRITVSVLDGGTRYGLRCGTAH